MEQHAHLPAALESYGLWHSSTHGQTLPQTIDAGESYQFGDVEGRGPPKTKHNYDQP